MSDGKKNSEIAQAINTTPHVVKNYLRTIYDKAGMSNRVELALWYLKQVHNTEREGAEAWPTAK